MEDRITELWWTGIRLWYNDQDFLRAMQVWDDAIACALESFQNSNVNQNQKNPSIDPLPPLLSSSTKEEEISSLNYVAPLLLFMAGCYLDAGDALKAQILCRWCLSTSLFIQSLLLASTTNTNSSNNDNFAHCVLSEYTSAFQEDLTIEKPCDKAYQVVEWALQKRQQALEEGQAVSSSHSFSCWAHPYQRPGFFSPTLSSQAIYSRDQHPKWCRQMEEEHYSTIRDEYQRLLQLHRRNVNGNNNAAFKSTAPEHWPRVGAGDHREGAGQHDASVVEKGGDWREIVLFGSGGERGPRVAPQTCSILEHVAPEAVDLARQGAGEIIFSVLAPHTHISPHCASTNLRLTAHLGLQIPTNNLDNDDNDQCYIEVAGEKLHWKEGKIIVFDDSFQHEVHNHTNEIRAVLLMRFWHFNLPRGERQGALQQLLDAKEADSQRRCNPPLPPPPSHHAGTNSNIHQTGMRRNPQGMSQKPCPACGRVGFETIRLVQPETGLFQCLCGQDVVS